MLSYLAGRCLFLGVVGRRHDPVERSHTQIIWLLAQGRSVLEVSEVTSYSRNWSDELARSYTRENPAALVDC